MQKATRIAAAIMAFALIFVVSVPALAINVQLNGYPLTFDVPPVMEGGRTLVPMRAIFEALGARITWDAEHQTISAVHPELDRYVILKVGSTTAWVDGHQVTLDVAPKLIDGRTMVPLRFVSTAMGAEVTWEDATQTIHIQQQTLSQPTDETPTESSVDPSTDETTDTDRNEAQLLSGYTRAIAYTHLEETWLCVIGMENRFGDYAYAFESNDPEWLDYIRPYFEATADCWDAYEENLLPTLTVPAGAKAAHEALQRWVDLNQAALALLQQADQAHTNGDLVARDALFMEGQQVLVASFQQEETMLQAMNEIVSPDAQFLTVAEHQYVSWLDEMMGASDNCFSELNMIKHTEGEAAYWAKAAAHCMAEFPLTLSEEEPPTQRMTALQQNVLAELPPIATRFSSFAEKVQGGLQEPEALNTEIDAIYDAWFELLPTWDRLFTYRDWGKF